MNLLSRDVPEAGVVAASGGNHGAAVAYAAKTLGVPAKIVVPNVSSPAKIARIKQYGADLVVGGERYADALATSETWEAQSGAMSVHLCTLSINRKRSSDKALWGWSWSKPYRTLIPFWFRSAVAD